MLTSAPIGQIAACFTPIDVGVNLSLFGEFMDESTASLNNRQKEVLEIIIGSHIQTAVPIGSGFVSDILDLSSATIRNVMGELEDMGYICKPHTSAGRLPTCTGYRYYVNHVIKLDKISSQQKKFIEDEYDKSMDSIDAILNRISHLLSVVTKQAGMACISNLKFYLEGTSNMIDMPEFKNPQKMRKLLRLFDEKDELVRLLEEDLLMDGVKIHISEEDRPEMFRDLSLVTANYKVKDSKKGSLGVIGPVRMNYSAVIPLVDFLSKTIEALFEDMETL